MDYEYINLDQILCVNVLLNRIRLNPSLLCVYKQSLILQHSYKVVLTSKYRRC